MKVYYDYQALVMQRFGGISRYYRELIEKLENRENLEINIKCFLSQNEYFRSFPGVNTVRPYHWRLGKIIGGLNRILSQNIIEKDGYDIIHPTYYDPYFLGNKKARKVVTIHDMTQELFPEYYLNDPIIEKKKRNIYESDHIIAISENTKSDILRLYPDIDPEKITVIYHGSTVLNSSDIRSGIRLPEKYVLFVGERYLYKNFRKFYEAMLPILEDSSIHIVCSGGGSFRKSELELFGKYSERIHQYSMNDSDLRKAYENAICFVFPSRYEGFGLPVLEAFECGCPVVMSNTSSLPEVGGDAADYFDPDDINSIRESVSTAISESEKNRSAEMKEKRQNQRKKFSWDIAAEKMYNCYQRIL